MITMKKTVVLFVLCWLSLVTVTAQNVLQHIIKDQVIRVGLTADQPPFAMEAIDGSLIGFEVDLAHLIADAMNVKLELIQMSFKDLLPSLEKGEIDVVMSGMTMTVPRNMKYAFVGPYIVTGKSILSRSASYSKANIHELNTKNVKIASLTGSTSEVYAKSQFPDARHVSVTDYEEAIQLLRNNEIIALVADYLQCTYIAHKNSTDRFYVTDVLFTSERIGFAISSNEMLLVNLLSNFLNEIEYSGQLNKLENEWIRSLDWMDRVE